MSQRFQLGQRVTVSSTFKYAGDWRDWQGFVSAVKAVKTGNHQYEVSDQWPPDTGCTDGFDETDLSPL